MWTRYNFSAINAVKDFGVGIGVLYQSSRYHGLREALKFRLIQQ
jgi:hypothetical protein